MNRIGVVLLSLVVSGTAALSCGPSLPPGRVQQTWHVPSANDTDWNALFVADSQLHNFTGSYIRSQSTFSALASAVAVRPSELNLLAGLVLEDVLARYRGAMNGRRDGSVFYLGDSMNLACGSEAVRFMNTMDDALAGVPWFMAHGNHDSFMSGVFNSFIPNRDELYSSHLTKLVKELRSHGLGNPTDSGVEPVRKLRPFHEFSWWPAASGRKYAYSSRDAGPGWPGVCAAPGEEAVPMNKLAWLAWYLDAQQRQGVTFTKLGSDADDRVIEGQGSTGDFTTVISGQLHPPRANHLLMNSWQSFVVQAVLRRDTAVFLIDTSVSEDGGRAGLRNIRSTVGSVGRVGDEQFKVVRALLKRLVNSRRVVFAGHHPIADLTPADQLQLKELMREARASTYLSAHTHAPGSAHVVTDAGVTEINVGSTTDWPMEGGVVRLADVSPTMQVFRAGLDCGLKYHGDTGELSLKRPQACVHEPVARKIAQLSDSSVETLMKGIEAWKSPEVPASCDLGNAALSLERDMKLIEQRAHSSEHPKFRDFLLCLATQASSIQCGSGYDATCDSRLQSSQQAQVSSPIGTSSGP